MRKVIFLCLFSLINLCVLAAPAKRTGWKTIQLSDGTTIKAQLKGDEFMHYMEDAEGRKFVFNASINAFEPMDVEKAKSKAVAKRTRANTTRVQKRAVTLGKSRSPFVGKKRILMILVEFQDKKFLPAHTLELFNNAMNSPGFTNEMGFKGSVKDYFSEQSRDSLNLQFDVVGPITLANNYAYYGTNDKNDYDQNPEEMVIEACKAVDDDVDFSHYDWNNDGEVDVVYVLFAGQGENSTADTDPNTIWPHQGELWWSNRSITLDKTKIDSYACGAELVSPTNIDGIGTICHELSHSFGLADMYDTADNGSFGLCNWGVMDYGLYNGNGFVPAGYTAYERLYMGWLKPIELKSDTTITNMKALTNGGDAYIYYNGSTLNEYYILENRQKQGFDAQLSGAGLLVYHVDFDATAWAYNEVNTDPLHQRCTIIHADNSAGDFTVYGTLNVKDLAGDPFPYADNDSLTATSLPNASLFNTNTDGTKFMNYALTGITRNSDSTITFTFKTVVNKTMDKPTTNPEGVLFHETFDNCNGTGGNSGGFGGRVALSTNAFVPDNVGWSQIDNKMYGGDKCAKFGTSSTIGVVSSPAFTTTGTDTLVFVAAPFGNDPTTIDVYANNVLLGVYKMTSNQWTSFTIPFAGVGVTNLKFIPSKRFFLDDVKVLGARTLTDIHRVNAEKVNILSTKIYNLSGQYVGDNLSVLPKGIYIRGGKKIVK